MNDEPKGSSGLRAFLPHLICCGGPLLVLLLISVLPPISRGGWVLGGGAVVGIGALIALAAAARRARAGESAETRQESLRRTPDASGRLLDN